MYINRVKQTIHTKYLYNEPKTTIPVYSSLNVYGDDTHDSPVKSSQKEDERERETRVKTELSGFAFCEWKK